jgi:hypothetical protein
VTQFARQAIRVNAEFWIGHLQLGQACKQLRSYDLAPDAMQNPGLFSGGNNKVIARRA